MVGFYSSVEQTEGEHVIIINKFNWLKVFLAHKPLRRKKVINE
jgi:hypothetical protein